MFLLVLAHPGCAGQNPESCKMVVVVVVVVVVVLVILYVYVCVCVCIFLPVTAIRTAPTYSE